MELCVLPQTGVAEAWLPIVIVAAVLIASGVALAVSRRGRRAVLTGLGALAVVGALVIAGIGGAAPAQADAGSSSCVAQHRPTPAPALTLVTPGIPTTTAQCAAEPSVQVPTTQGVTYTQSRTGTTLTITAAPAAGFAFVAGATTSWTFDMTPTTAAPWPVTLPERAQATPTEGTPWFGGAYLQPLDELLVPALEEAAQAGSLTYSLDASQWRFVIDVVAYDSESGAELGRRTVEVPIPSELSFDFESGLYLLVSDTDPSATINAQLVAAADSLDEEFPDSDIEQDFADFSDIYQGLQIIASYEPGPGCGTVTQTVPIDLVFVLGRGAASDSLQALPGDLDVSIPQDEAPTSGAPAETPASQQPAESDAAEGDGTTDGDDPSDAESADASTPDDAVADEVDATQAPIEP